jgi:ubiquinone/menaquinone biosynthesis C-methylase UbiE
MNSKNNCVNVKKIWQNAMSNAKYSSQQNQAPVEHLISNIAYFLRNKKLSTKGIKVLEIGCGFSPTLVHLAKQGMDVSGVDLSKVCIDSSKKLFKTNGLTKQVNFLLQGDFTDENLKIPENYYDLVIESNVIPFVEKDRLDALFDRVYRILKQGGAFIARIYRDTNYTIFVDNPKRYKKDGFTMYFGEATKGGYHLTDAGFAHFFSEKDMRLYLKRFKEVDLGFLEFSLPEFEAKKRGFDKYVLSYWRVTAVK